MWAQAVRLVPVEGGSRPAPTCSEQLQRICVAPGPSSQTGDSGAVGSPAGRMEGVVDSCLCRGRAREGAHPCLSCFLLHC